MDLCFWGIQRGNVDCVVVCNPFVNPLFHFRVLRIAIAVG